MCGIKLYLQYITWIAIKCSSIVLWLILVYISLKPNDVQSIDRGLIVNGKDCYIVGEGIFRED